ncbi:lytic transglycosylase domain-containing protein [Ponticoccus sp. SC2-23]|uniref:transglycosylase SLT domain-containing protein n=1 Tax=Alexandriicola marinus TaxID=2081710 RepID=UPI000FDCD075|nr:lytic transglycosylase domain-containing protein [Ponticoccus sp. SC6-9]MBM1223843.1 lytic transglycosylase domain-containing protein [Ponticoccus sp. SC6-15]MBM1228899.1 lytic transglycosylase domain-containing protein [Ponticoccus sp. SC6-38]MBM1232809.1 lytic transglycosylase domain-containing protein [Ponticoccus sp. SC6-45]MBM1237241.1 lytic transglycosylase domain-containing protein [Ponticoccus sp. SC6-49]MBM1241820.1 lytic transglycosylase domain-containing protein [Ponticoccus sp. 
MIRAAMMVLTLGLAACSNTSERAAVSDDTFADVGLFPNETPELRALINEYAEFHQIPSELIHRVIQRESDYRPEARNGPYWGMMQILPQTAAQMGHDGPPSQLLDPEVTLRYAGKYLRGAWLVSGGDIDEAVMWYARGYYYEARDNCLLIETGLLEREVARHCREA